MELGFFGGSALVAALGLMIKKTGSDERNAVAWMDKTSITPVRERSSESKVVLSTLDFCLNCYLADTSAEKCDFVRPFQNRSIGWNYNP